MSGKGTNFDRNRGIIELRDSNSAEINGKLAFRGKFCAKNIIYAEVS